MSPTNKPLIILGIDPGLADTGFGVIEKCGSKIKTLDYGSIKTKAKTPDQDRLKIIEQELSALIKKYQPEIIGVEKLFFAKNVKTALAVGQARGVVILCAGKHCLLLKEFTPLQVKMALTSYGQADKKQVQQMIKVVLGLKEIPKPDDAADALAIAVCAAHSI
ncbi:MAG: crossover junction endodeoxyribonuclease RuvC [Candidatus Buchananbacteria bacterium]